MRTHKSLATLKLLQLGKEHQPQKKDSTTQLRKGLIVDEQIVVQCVSENYFVL